MIQDDAIFHHNGFSFSSQRTLWGRLAAWNNKTHTLCFWVIISSQREGYHVKIPVFGRNECQPPNPQQLSLQKLPSVSQLHPVNCQRVSEPKWQWLWFQDSKRWFPRSQWALPQGCFLAISKSCFLKVFWSISLNSISFFQLLPILLGIVVWMPNAPHRLVFGPLVPDCWPCLRGCRTSDRIMASGDGCWILVMLGMRRTVAKESFSVVTPRQMAIKYERTDCSWQFRG